MNIAIKTHITKDPEILGGIPVIKGTRIPIEKIKFLILQDFPISAIKNMYPHVPKKTLKAVIDEIFNISLKSPEHVKSSTQV